MASFSGIAFDLDGVLVESAPVHSRAFSQVFQSVGAKEFDYGRWAGMRTCEVIVRVLAENAISLPAVRLEELSAWKSRLALEWLAADPPIISGCYGLLSMLRKNFSLALASSASPAGVELFLDRSGCRTLFSIVLTAVDVRSSKPAAEIYERAAVGLGLVPAQMLVVEDAVAGVQAGRRAGCRVWAVRGTARDEDLLAAGAERVLDSVLDLMRESVDGVS